MNVSLHHMRILIFGWHLYYTLVAQYTMHTFAYDIPPLGQNVVTVNATPLNFNFVQ